MKKTCSQCGETKDVKLFRDKRNTCRSCFLIQCTERTAERRRQRKKDLVEYFGSKCTDCGYEGPAFAFDFDHRDPLKKEFSISREGNRGTFEEVLAEAKKCDLVCAICHRIRTHVQRCSGCILCDEDAEPVRFRNRVEHKFCALCGKKLHRQNKGVRCQDCIGKYKITWPELDDLIAMIKGSNFRQVARRLGISDNAVRKHLSTRGIDPKSIK